MDDIEMPSLIPEPSAGVERTVTTSDGRKLACLEVGDPGGSLVLHNHGGPSSRLEARLFADAAARNCLRFLCVDRPGIGQSSPLSPRSYAGWAEDLTAIADALAYSEFGVTGWSEGGPWALAAAAYIDPARSGARRPRRDHHSAMILPISAS
jgi:pimeloyl-ACP methyl ester carboxylesterase